MMKSNVTILAKRIGEGVLLLAGAFITAYYLLAFSVTKKGVYFFKSENQTWLAVGVALVVTGLMIRKWHRL